jgi:hypothetical protein
MGLSLRNVENAPIETIVIGPLIVQESENYMSEIKPYLKG